MVFLLLVLLPKDNRRCESIRDEENVLCNWIDTELSGGIEAAETTESKHGRDFDESASISNVGGRDDRVDGVDHQWKRRRLLRFGELIPEFKVECNVESKSENPLNLEKNRLDILLGQI